MASTESGRGTKRPIDDIQSEEDAEDALEGYGKLLWDSMVYHNSVDGLVDFIPSSEDGKNGFFVIGFDRDRTRWWKSSEPTWRNYADIWLATRTHPGETVETIDSRPTQKELSNRMNIFIRKALDEQKKYGISRIKVNHSCPNNVQPGAIIVSGPTNKNHHVAKSQANLPTASEHEGRGFDFYDGLAHAARQNFIQQTNDLRVNNKYLSTMLRDARAALSDTRKEIEKLTEKAEKKIRDLSATLDEERNSAKDQLEELRKAHQKDMNGAESEIRQLRTDIDANKKAASSELKREKEARLKAAKESGAVVKKLQAEKKSLLKASEEASATIQSLGAKVKKFSSKLEKERQDRQDSHEAIKNAVEESQQRMAKHHSEVMESENKKLKQEKEAHAQLRDKVVKLEETNRTLQATINRFMAVANDVRP